MAWYPPKLEVFLRALERAEKDEAEEPQKSTDVALSARMRKSWENGQFWFDYAIRKSHEVDGTYWTTLHERNEAYQELGGPERDEMEAFVHGKMAEFDAYCKECDVRFGKKDVEEET
jgi:hypothetical protein